MNKSERENISNKDNTMEFNDDHQQNRDGEDGVL